MIKNIEIKDSKDTKESNICINCDLLNDWNRNEFIKKLIDLCEEYKKCVDDSNQYHTNIINIDISYKDLELIKYWKVSKWTP